MPDELLDEIEAIQTELAAIGFRPRVRLNYELGGLMYPTMKCVWCDNELPYPAIVPYVARGSKAICMTCIAGLSRIMADQQARGRLTSLPPDACGGGSVDRESSSAAGAGEA